MSELTSLPLVVGAGPGCGGVLAALVAVLGALLLLGRRGLTRAAEPASRARLEQLVVAQLAEALSSRLALGTKDELAAALSGEQPPADALRVAWDAGLGPVRLQVARTDDPGRVATILLTGPPESPRLRVRGSLPWDDLPGALRERFLRTGDRQIELPWAPPWAPDGVPGPAGATPDAGPGGRP